MSIVLSDESLNRYGFRVKTSGIELEAFRANPVMFYDHRTWEKPVGRWENIRVEGDKLLADPVFDENDEQGKDLKRKYDNGFLNAASVQFDVLETNNTDVIAGQRRATVTKCDLMEVSIVGIPSNKRATRSLSLKSGDYTVRLGGDDLEEVLPSLLQVEEQQTPPESGEVVTLILEIGEMKGIVNAGNRNEWQALAKADSGAVRKLFAKLPSAEKSPQNPPRFSKSLQQTPQEPAQGRGDWGFEKWSKEDPQGLLSIKRNDPERYAELANNYKP
jgi:HK97 family phage prohead protease